MREKDGRKKLKKEEITMEHIIKERKQIKKIIKKLITLEKNLLDTIKNAYN